MPPPEHLQRGWGLRQGPPPAGGGGDLVFAAISTLLGRRVLIADEASTYSTGWAYQGPALFVLCSIWFQTGMTLRSTAVAIISVHYVRRVSGKQLHKLLRFSTSMEALSWSSHRGKGGRGASRGWCQWISVSMSGVSAGRKSLPPCPQTQCFM